MAIRIWRGPLSRLIQADKKPNTGLRRYQKSSRISNADKTHRDLLIYLIWQLGAATNQQIGEKFGSTYSAVSRRVGIFKNMLKKDKALQDRFNKIKPQIKI
jgi:chromosomal replication initiation ATPase DnaA